MLLSHGVPPIGGVKQGRVGKISSFLSEYLETVADTAKVSSND